MVKTKVLISFAVTAKLNCVFVFAYAKNWFSLEAAHIYRCVSTLIYMDIQIGWQVYRSAGRHVHTLACI